MATVVGLLLAAGSSRRFGFDKLNHNLPDGEPIAVHACRNLLSGTDAVLAVVRPGDKKLAASLKAEGVEVQVCENAAQGMGASLAFAVRNCPDAAGWVIALADMPWIAPVTIKAVADTLRSGSAIAIPCWQGRRGHPVEFSRCFGADLSALAGDLGAKALIQAHTGQVCLVECNDPAILWDIDKPEDLHRPLPHNMP